MKDDELWQSIHPAGTFSSSTVFIDIYPAAFDDGSQIVLPIRALPDGDHAVASLIINQASFTVVAAIAANLAAQLRPFAPEIIVGIPTLGLTLAAAVALAVGHTRYVPLGTSRKFWYDERLSVPVSSITSPDSKKRLYIDPRMLDLLAGRRVALIDDVISSGASMAAGIRLLSICGCMPVVFGAAMLQSERWRESLADVPAERIVTTLKTPILVRTGNGWWMDATVRET